MMTSLHFSNHGSKFPPRQSHSFANQPQLNDKKQTMKTFSLALLIALFFGNAAAFMTAPSKAAVKVDTPAEESSTSLAYGYGTYK
jgi:hypothetical protein